MNQACKHSDKVLNGNRAEERLHFTQDCETANSVYRMDYTPHMSHRPDDVTCQRALHRSEFTQDCETANSVYRMDYTPHMSHRPDDVTCRRVLHRSEGLPLRQLFSHHDVPSSHCLVSQYDESYGRQASSLPTLHSWSAFKLARVPERSDHPIQGPPTNFGLATSWRARVEQQRAFVPTLSEYRASYPQHPISAFCYSHHVSMPKRFSSSQHPANLRNEDLALKHRPCRQVSSNPDSLL